MRYPHHMLWCDDKGLLWNGLVIFDFNNMMNTNNLCRCWTVFFLLCSTFAFTTKATEKRVLTTTPFKLVGGKDVNQVKLNRATRSDTDMYKIYRNDTLASEVRSVTYDDYDHSVGSKFVYHIETIEGETLMAASVPQHNAAMWTDGIYEFTALGSTGNGNQENHVQKQVADGHVQTIRLDGNAGGKHFDGIGLVNGGGGGDFCPVERLPRTAAQPDTRFGL